MDNISYLLVKSSRFLKKALDTRLLQYNITARQFSVLHQIALKNGRTTLAEVADALESDRPTISGVINRLEKNGLLTKIENPTDGRSAYLALNEKALALLEALRAASDQVNQEAFDIFNEAELANLTSYLTRLMDHISERY